MNKIKVSKRVADLIEEYDERYYVTSAIAEIALENEYTEVERLQAINGLLNDYEVEESYKVGDYFTCLIEGKKITGVLKDDGLVHWLDGVTNEISYIKLLVSDGDVSIASEDEIKRYKEEKLWKSIGREVGEFYEGDTYLTTFGYAGEFDSPSKLKIIYDLYSEGKLKGFYPAESFVSL